MDDHEIAQAGPGAGLATGVAGLQRRHAGEKLVAAGRLAGLAGRVAYHVAKERLTNPRPVTLREVPPTP